MLNNGCDVIITYCWNRVGYNILRSLSSHGLKVWAADTSKMNICSKSKYCSGSFIYPDPFTQEEQFITCLVQKVENLKPIMLIPTHDESLVIMRNREKFPKEVIIPYMDGNSLLNASDKSWATQKALECGVPTPRVYKNVNEVNEFPCVFKTVIGNSAKTVFFPTNTDELLVLADKFKGQKVLIEEKIGGTDYSVDCIRWEGFFHASTYRALVTKTDGGGTTTQRMIVEMPTLETYARILLDFIGFKGVCGIDFRYDPEADKSAFIEINARFTGGIATPITAGFDIPWVLYCLATKGIYSKEIHPVIGTKTKWILGDIITMVERTLSLNFNIREWCQALTFKGFDAFDDYRGDDKQAIWGEMAYYLGKLLKHGKLNP